MPKCSQCGRNYCYAKNDLKAGRVKHPEICIICSQKLNAKELRMGEKSKVGKEKKYFKTQGDVKNLDDEGDF